MHGRMYVVNRTRDLLNIAPYITNYMDENLSPFTPEFALVTAAFSATNKIILSEQLIIEKFNMNRFMSYGICLIWSDYVD